MAFNKPFILDSYTKAEKVVDSCHNLIHCDSARKFIDCFLDAYHDKYSIYPVDDMTMTMYLRLRARLDAKKESLAL